MKIAILPQFLAIKPHFVRKACRGHFKIPILYQFLAIEPRFVRKGCRRGCRIVILYNFLAIQAAEVINHNFTIEARFVRKGCRRGCRIAILHPILVIEPRFVRKDCVSCRFVGTAPRLKRDIEKTEKEEDKRARDLSTSRAQFEPQPNTIWIPAEQNLNIN